MVTNDFIKTGSYYFLSNANGTLYLWGVAKDGMIDVHFNKAYGIRPIVELKAGITKTSGSGTNASPYNISI